MQIFVKLITGENITLEVESSDTVEAVKGKIEEKEGIPARIQRLVFGGNELQEGITLADYDVKPGDTILLFPVNIGSIKFFVTNMTAECGEHVILGEDYRVVLTANDDYVLPKDISVKANGTLLVDNTGYIYDSSTGVIVIYGANVTGEIEIIADAIELFDVTVSANNPEYGSVSGTAEVRDGDSITISATPNDGYKFVRWIENGIEVSTDADYTFTVNADRNLVAEFEKIEVVPPTMDSNNVFFLVALSLLGMILIVKGVKTWKTI